ncbi:MAG: ADP-forming succinate--CoA ligase subunit beta [Limisphaerales bacterium]
MNIHEFQAKELLSSRGVAIPPGEMASTAGEAVAAANRLLEAGAKKIAIKVQIHAGGRGRGTFKSGFQGGVKLSTSADEIGEFARQMLGEVLVTRQTGPEGRLVSKVLITEAPVILKEYYLAVLLDRNTCRPLLMASAEGGVEIEEVAVRSPEKIIRESIDPAVGLMPYQARRVAVALGFRGELIGPAARLFDGVWRTWWECDASMVEINPLCLIRTPAGQETVVALDAKVGLDDNALYRHPELRAMRDLAEEAPLEIEAGEAGLSYIKLEGNIACLVNGAGLAMATMDVIKSCGGNPANFLDVGGGASRDQVTAAFRIILKDPAVKGILVNIFGGIMDCDVIAHGIVAAVQETGLPLPLVVRMEGNNFAAGRKTLETSGLTIISGSSMADAAQKIVRAVTG